MWLGVQALRKAGPDEPIGLAGGAGLARRAAFRDALLTGITNPKLAVVFVALFPQFVPAGADVLTTTLLRAITIVVLDVAWYGALAAAVARARRSAGDALAGTWLERGATRWT